jgi:alpha-glucosidase
MFAADGPMPLVAALSERFGHQPPLPDWAIGGAIVGLKMAAAVLNGSKRLSKRAPPSPAMWCEDWAGIRETSFGRRLFWDWRRDQQRYRDLPAQIAALHARGIRFLAYANPYLAADGILYEEAADKGHFCLKPDERRALSGRFRRV